MLDEVANVGAAWVPGGNVPSSGSAPTSHETRAPVRSASASHWFLRACASSRFPEGVSRSEASIASRAVTARRAASPTWCSAVAVPFGSVPRLAIAVAADIWIANTSRTGQGNRQAPAGDEHSTGNADQRGLAERHARVEVRAEQERSPPEEGDTSDPAGPDVDMEDRPRVYRIQLSRFHRHAGESPGTRQRIARLGDNRSLIRRNCPRRCRQPFAWPPVTSPDAAASSSPGSVPSRARTPPCCS